MAILELMLDVLTQNSTQIKTNVSRWQFTIILGKSLMSDQLKRTLHIQRISKDLHIQNALGETVDNEKVEEVARSTRKYQRISFCPKNNDRKKKTSAYLARQQF